MTYDITAKELNELNIERVALKPTAALDEALKSLGFNDPIYLNWKRENRKACDLCMEGCFREGRTRAEITRLENVLRVTLEKPL